MSKEFMSSRTRMALAAGTLWLILAFWSASAFWEHIDQLESAYPVATKIGALASIFVLLALVLFHCFDKHIGVRKWALVFTLILTGLDLIHAGALRGLKEATIAQRDTETRMAEQLSKMSAEQAKAIQADQTGTQKERLAKQRAALAQKAEVAKSAQEKVAATIAKSSETVKDNSILPKWYLDGWMYSFLFLASSLFLGIIFLLMMRDDIDADFDGVIDAHQQQYRLAPVPSPAMAQDRRQIGFPTSPQVPSHNFTYGTPNRQPEADDPKGPPPLR